MVRMLWPAALIASVMPTIPVLILLLLVAALGMVGLLVMMATSMMLLTLSIRAHHIVLIHVLIVASASWPIAASRIHSTASILPIIILASSAAAAALREVVVLVGGLVATVHVVPV